MLRIKQINEPDDQLRELIRGLDELMIALYPPESNHLLALESLFNPHTYIAGAFDGDELIGCGAVLNNGDRTAELKRLVLKPGHRGGGVAALILAALESHLRAGDVDVLRLETGIHQPSALAFFGKSGFQEIAAFGSYLPDPLSVFMEKTLCESKPKEA